MATLLDTLRQLDLNGNGKIACDDLAHVFKSIEPEVWSDAKLDVLLAMLPTGADGAVGVEDVVSCVMEGGEMCSNLPEHTRKSGPPFVIAVCGTSCCGKTTIAAALAEELNKLAAPPAGGPPQPPGLIRQVSSRVLIRSISEPGCRVSSFLEQQRIAAYSRVERKEYEASEAIHADDFFVFDQYCTDGCPIKQTSGHVWKDWESTSSIDWEGLVEGIQRAKAQPMCPKYLVVEGFLLLAKPESRALFDAVVEVSISKDECWRRRRARAEKMGHLPPGFSTSEEEKNYEVLETYVQSNVDQDAIHAEATSRYPDQGNLAWLRMYFEEVVWPASVEQADESAKLSAGGLPVLRIDANTPAGKEEWKAANVPRSVEFCSRVLAP